MAKRMVTPVRKRSIILGISLRSFIPDWVPTNRWRQKTVANRVVVRKTRRSLWLVNIASRSRLSFGALDLLWCHPFHSCGKSGAPLAGNLERRVKYLDQVCDRHGIVRPIGNLLDRVFGTELFNLRPYYLCQSSSYLLRQVSLVRGKVQSNECNDQGPIYWFTAATPRDAPQGHQQNDNAKIDEPLRNH